MKVLQSVFLISLVLPLASPAWGGPEGDRRLTVHSWIGRVLLQEEIHLEDTFVYGLEAELPLWRGLAVVGRGAYGRTHGSPVELAQDLFLAEGSLRWRFWPWHPDWTVLGEWGAGVVAFHAPDPFIQPDPRLNQAHMTYHLGAGLRWEPLDRWTVGVGGRLRTFAFGDGPFHERTLMSEVRVEVGYRF